jgi:hypothetical protein
MPELPRRGRRRGPRPARLTRRPGQPRRHDILLRFDEEKARDGEDLARPINTRKPEEKVSLVLPAARITADATLTLGPP